MKKAILILGVIAICFMFTNKNENEYVIVPNNSIRFRIIPNSNTLEDINMKEKVKNEIATIINDVESSKDINESRKNIVQSIPQLEEKIDNLFEKENYNMPYKINYGMNYFPEKIYKGVKYNEGDYESMVIEIGEASGDNYWCVLFPPLCLIDAEESETEDVEYSFFISEIIKKFFK